MNPQDFTPEAIAHTRAVELAQLAIRLEEAKAKNAALTAPPAPVGDLSDLQDLASLPAAQRDAKHIEVGKQILANLRAQGIANGSIRE